MFKILAGKDRHPYLTEKEVVEVYEFPAESRNLRAAALMIDAPGVLWPEGVRESCKEDLVAVVEGLLSRHRNRFGLKEV